MPENIQEPDLPVGLLIRTAYRRIWRIEMKLANKCTCGSVVANVAGHSDWCDSLVPIEEEALLDLGYEDELVIDFANTYITPRRGYALVKRNWTWKP